VLPLWLRCDYAGYTLFLLREKHSWEIILQQQPAGRVEHLETRHNDFNQRVKPDAKGRGLTAPYMEEA